MDYNAINDAENAEQDEEDKAEVIPALSFAYAYTPYSDITEQEDFAVEYRRKIVLLYFTFLPISILLSAAIAKYWWNEMLVSKILLFCAIAVLFVGVPYFTFLGFFTVAHFLTLPIWFYAWPLFPLFIGSLAMLVTNEKDSAFGTVLVVVSVLVLLTNELARQMSWWTEAERLLQWPPLPGTDPLEHL